MNKIKIIKRTSLFKLICVFILLSIIVLSEVKLPRLISDGMVLQRNKQLTIWGWDNSNQQITIHFLKHKYHTESNQNGKWEIVLPEMQKGGPYKMVIVGSNKVTISDIMVGEVWISSGQSNMELPMRRVQPIYQSEIANSKNDSIRYFDVPDNYNFKKPQNDLQAGKWVSSNPETVLDFSAVAYFFSKILYQRYKLPIGIINASLGGSPAEAWISEETLNDKFPKYYKEAQRFKDSSLVDSIKNSDQNRIESWYSELKEKDRGYKGNKTWHDPDLKTSNWSKMTIPGYWAAAELGSLDGSVWFRKKVALPDNLAGERARLILGRIVDADSVFVNGEFVGSTTYQYPPRRYKIPAGILKKGKNTIVIRIVNVRGKGGFFLDKPYKLIVDDEIIDLKGKWKYRLGAKMPPLESQTFIRWKPVGLYNAMIAPLTDYSMRGVIWYQGESNTDRPQEYEQLFKTLIKDWRDKWSQGDFPFLYVQLANFMEAKEKPSQSNWALLRESQLETLSLPNTGMAVTIDIGEWNDIHPLNKKDVGKRLALAARKIAYNEDIVYSGPLYDSMEIKGNKIVLSFKHIGSGLVAKGDNKLHGFAIAGKDSNFVWATAKIKNNKIVVWSDKIDNPIAVRYAWADNPKNSNLFNEEGLPASPFRTDNWNKK